MKQEGQDRRVDRRRFLGYVIAGAGAFIGTVVGASGSIFAASPLLGGKDESRANLGPVDSFQVGVPKTVEFSIQQKDGWMVENNARKTVWVVKRADRAFDIYSARCTHLGCAFSWQAEEQRFLCPCHNGKFSLDGRVLGGPVPRGLDKMEYSVEGSNLVVNYKEFRLGVPEKVEA